MTAVDSSKLLFSGGVGAFGGGTEITGRGGNGGNVTISSGSLDLFDTTQVKLNGGNANGTHQNPNRGGHGGIITVNGGAVSVNNSTSVTLNGGKGSNTGVSGPGGNGGDGGQILVSTGSLTVNGGDVTLKRGNPGSGPGGLGVAGADALIDVTGGTFEMNGGEVYTGTFQRSGGGVFNFNDGKLTVAGGTFDPGAAAYTIEGPSAVELPTLVLADGATAPGVTSEMIVGNNNRGRLEILTGATLSSSNPDLGSQSTGYGEALVDGAGSTWMITGGDIAVGESGTGDLTVSNGGLVAAGDDFVVGRGSTANGTALITSGGSVTTVGSAWIGEAGIGVLTVDGGGSLSVNNNVNIAVFGSSNGTLDVSGAGSLVDANDSLYVGGWEFGVGGTGELNVAAGATVDVANELKVWAPGTVNFSSGTVIASTITDTSGGAFNFTGGDLYVDTYEGDLVNQGGNVLPGASPGITDVTGTYDQQSGALEIEILSGGLSPVAGVDFDRLTADTVLLSDTLDIVMDPGYLPVIGDLFEIISASTSVSGTFATVNSSYITGGLVFDVLYNVTDVTLELTAGLPGDFDLDNDVDGTDFLIWQRGETPDLTADYADWSANFGTVLPAVVATSTAVVVPEPASLVMIVVGLALVGTRRRGSGDA